MTAKAAEIIDGKKIAETIRGELKAEVKQLQEKHGVTPGLAVVLVGERKDSQTYVRSKKKACEEVGIKSFGVDLPDTATEDEVLKVVADFNADPAVHGILVQLPLPKHIDETRVLDAISLEKDVDGKDPSAKRGYRLVGDVKFDEAKEKASFITPVPGGVGPMTIAMLLRNTVDGATRAAAEQ
ncbi:hypothetical protein QBZ16_000500 [Prototheca wickerhamii]|uniref:Methenyltetrahydrofolate cyclohydrolase n=1 Tax=Prototheca wickerhamii TaxID=3111 RepID=A0AAD9ILF4_PROWI|nr:hypothetical protein QBZ16_000500 [Prototheca wickerhamii]